MPNGGKIVIESRNIKIKEHDNNVDSMPRGHYAQITITDTGIGINAETQAHIFEPFFTSKPLDKGTGMGLFTVNEIINKMNGRIFIRSEVNIGTVVTFYIPINAPIKSLPIKETKQACGATILLVEDNEALRRVMSRILRQDNYEILEAANGEAANTLFEQNKKSIRLIITDIVMPKLGGLELAKHLKSAYPDIRIIFTSGYDNNVTRNQTDFEFGDAFLQKPVTQIELLKHVKQSLNSAKKTDKTGL